MEDIRRRYARGQRELCYDGVISLSRDLRGAMSNTDFRGRCESALTHAVTITAICTLLVNDLVFKSLWPGAWVTGKLSDLAWVVFAPPLLAFLLSFAARGNVHAQRAAFAAGYLGLPLLYAAFNTFEPVHDAITRGLSLASGRASGGPLDPTDSLVIPFGTAAALWVWRRPSTGSSQMRARAALLVASLASLASVASTPFETELGITSVGFNEDGTLVTFAGISEYPSVGEQSVETPRGIYAIEGSDVVRTIGGRKEVAYSAAYLRERGNMNLQARATRHIQEREITTRPYSIAYDQRTGNVVVAMGLQGIVVGTPDGRWTREAVGTYAPTDFSIVRKLLLLRDWELWLVAVAAALSFTALAMSLAEPASAFERAPAEPISSAKDSNRRKVVTYTAIGALVLIILLAMVWQVFFLFFLALLVPLLLAIKTGKTGRVIASVFAVIASIAGMLFYTEDPGFLSLSPFLSISGGALGLGLAVLVGAASYRQLSWVVSAGSAAERRGSIYERLRSGLLPVIAAAVGGMLALIALSFFLWAQQGVYLALAQLSAIGLTALTAFILRKYLKGMMPMMPKPMTVRMCPCGCGKMIEEHGV